MRSRDAEADLLEFVAPPLTAYGYRLVEHSAGRLVFERDTRPAWTFLAAVFAFPIGLFALLYTSEERVTIQLVARGDETVIVAQGVAPLRVRKAFALLEP